LKCGASGANFPLSDFKERLVVKYMRVDGDTNNDHHQGRQLQEKGSFGFRPMHDQEESTVTDLLGS
jgi:hypothetical protein